MTKITVKPIEVSKIDSVDFNNLPFGKVFTDHMFSCDFKDGKWQNPTISEYAPLTLDPSARVFHYGQAVFEGMKAYKDENDDIFMFRPEDNFNRINISAHRLAMPEFPKEIFFEAMEKMLLLDKEWIKKGAGKSLYIRPFVIATEPAISASPAAEYKFMIICSPAAAYFAGEVRVLFAEQYSRSANGGVGFAKAAGNYAAQFYPTNLANQEGYQQVLWTDSDTHEYLEESGTMNVFFRINDKLVTAPTSDRILDGITRKSIIQLVKDQGIDIEVRRVSASEIKEAASNGSLKEIFGSGTAAVIVPILGFKHKDFVHELPKVDDSYATLFKTKLNDIQYNKAEDKHNWRHLVKA